MDAPAEAPGGPSARRERLRHHVETHVGAVVGVVSAGSDLEILHVEPTEFKPFHVLVTAGMSDRAMPVPQDREASPRAELVLGLDPSWPFSPDALAQEAYAWPLQLLASLARLPRAHDLWFEAGHTVPNGNPPAPYVAATECCGVLLAPPLVFPPEFTRLDAAGEHIEFLAVVPLYAEEMKLKLDRGVDALYERLDAHHINEVLIPNRRKVAGGLFELL